MTTRPPTFQALRRDELHRINREAQMKTHDYDIAHYSIQCNADKIGAQVFERTVLVGAKLVMVRVLAHTEEQAMEMLPEYQKRLCMGGIRDDTIEMFNG